MGTEFTPATQPRYGRPKGSGLDDSRQLESIAALLAANPSLKPTTAIRSLGVEDPSVIRRLRDKFRLDQARLLANARHSFRTNGRMFARPGPLQTQRRAMASVHSNAPAAASPAAPDTPIAVESAVRLPQPPLLAIWCDLGLWALSTAIEQHAVLARHWLHHPAVEVALRGQLAVGAFLVAASTPRKPPKPRIH